MNKAVLGVYPGPKAHWVGDGFPVRSLFSYDQLGRHISPFLLLDYAAPTVFAPAARPRGVGEHPHRGFETVTIVYQGEVAHRDSVGNSGVIGPGDVQWMTAAAGILHEEFHSPAFTRRGGALEMAQLWVNLPAKHKMAPPRYQSIVSHRYRRSRCPTSAGTLRVIAGNYAGQKGPAATFSELNVWDAAATMREKKSPCRCPTTIARRLRCCAAPLPPTDRAKPRMPSWCCWIAAAAISVWPRGRQYAPAIERRPHRRTDRRLRAICHEHSARDRNGDG